MLFLVILGISVVSVNGGTFTSCPSYGCRPSGTFSYMVNLPSSSPKVLWNTTYGAIPNCLGCVGNINNIICPYNGPKSNGYVAIDEQKGTQMWYVPQLHNPSLPVMDNEGAIIGTDGHNMVKYLPDGTMIKPKKPVDPRLFPLFSVQLSDNGILAFASMSGVLFTMDTEGIPHAAISFNGTVERSNGTFIPVTTPIIVGNRIYILTQFKPEEDTSETRQPHILGMHRLYAVDIYLRMVDRLHTVWYANFEREVSTDTVLRFKPKTVAGDPLIMASVDESLIYVILPPPEGDVNMAKMFYAMKDEGNSTSLLYKRTISASKMAMYEMNGVPSSITSPKGKSSRSKLMESIKPLKTESAVISVWLLAESNNLIYKVHPTEGSIEMTLNLSSMLQGQAEVTSDIMVLRDSDDGVDKVIFGVTVTTSNESHNYVVAIQADGKLLWKVPTPANVAVKGQIAGLSAEGGTENDDMLVAFGNNGNTAAVFSIQ